MVKPMSFAFPVLLLIAAATNTAAVAAAGKNTAAVTVQQRDGAVAIRINGQPFAVLNLNRDGKRPKPYMWPVRGPGGVILTRPIERKGDDHPHHKGIWVAVDEVNGVRFWAEKGKIVTEKVAVSSGKGGKPGRITITNSWRNPQGETEVYEETVISIYPNRLLDYRITFRPAGKTVEFHDTKEGLLGFRMVNSMREKEGGKVISSRGEKGTANCWGKPAEWIDYYGPVQGKIFGVAIFDHPDNFRPSRYHVRNYGLFSISPFGEKAYTRGKQPAKPVVLKPGQSLTLRYALYIHAGDTRAAKVANVYKNWLRRTKSAGK